MLKIGMVSRWNPFHADEFVRGVNANPAAEVSWVWDEDQGRAWAQRLGVAHYVRLDEALAKGGADGVVLNCHPERMAPQAAMAAAHGHHILMDKIVAVGEAQRLALKASLAGKDLCVATAFALLRRSNFQTAKGVIESGALGRVSMVRMREAHDGLSAGRLPAHFTRDVPGGIFSDMGFHALYAIPWLLGEAPEWVSAAASDFCGTGCIDNGAYQLRFPGGAVGCAESSYASARSPFSLEVYGRDGCLLIGGPGKAILQNRDGDWLPVSPLPEKPLPEDDWIEAIRTGRPGEYGLEDGLLLSRRFEALCRSLDTGLPSPMV